MMADAEPRVRPATVADAAAIAAVDVASWRAAYRGIMPDVYLDALSVVRKTSDWERSLGRERERGKRTLVAEIGGDIAGFATVGPDIEARGIGLLFLMYVAPERWGSGCGRALMTASEAALRELGYEQAVLWVLEANTRARHFYEAAGWRPEGTRRTSDYGVPLVALRYERML